MSRIGDPSSKSLDSLKSMERPDDVKDKSGITRAQQESVIETSQTTISQRAVLEKEKEHPTADRLFAALDRGDMTEFSKIINSLDKQNVAKTMNATGQTISHLAILKHNIPAFLMLRQKSE